MVLDGDFEGGGVLLGARHHQHQVDRSGGTEFDQGIDFVTVFVGAAHLDAQDPAVGEDGVGVRLHGAHGGSTVEEAQTRKSPAQGALDSLIEAVMDHPGFELGERDVVHGGEGFALRGEPEKAKALASSRVNIVLPSSARPATRVASRFPSPCLYSLAPSVMPYHLRQHCVIVTGSIYT